MPVLPGHPGGGALHPGPGPAAVRDAATGTATRQSATAGGRSAVRDALDLCLACKGCKTDCPANVDMATYKAEFLAHHWRAGSGGGRAPTSPLGWLPMAARAVATGCGSAGLANALSHTPGLHRAAALIGRSRATRSAAVRPTEPAAVGGAGPPRRGHGQRGTVLLWPDTFTNYFHPHVGQAAVAVLEAAGWRVEIPAGPAVLRADLDLHRPARRRPSGCSADRRPARRACPRGRLRGRAGAELHRHVPRGRRRAVPRRPGRAAAPRPHGHPGRTAHRATPRAGSRRRSPAGRSWPRCTATSTPSLGWDADATLLDAGGRPGSSTLALRVLRAGRQLRLPAPATTTSAWPAPSRCCSPGSARRRPRRGDTRRRLQLPDPDPRARQRRPGGHAPGRTARRRPGRGAARGPPGTARRPPPGGTRPGRAAGGHRRDTRRRRMAAARRPWRPCAGEPAGDRRAARQRS